MGFKELLLKPAVTGFVHPSSAAPVIAEIVISRSTSRHFKRILDETLAFIGIADHGALKIGSREDSWGHMERIEALRNAVLHRGDLAEHGDAEAAIQIAGLIINRVFPCCLGSQDCSSTMALLWQRSHAAMALGELGRLSPRPRYDPRAMPQHEVRSGPQLPRCLIGGLTDPGVVAQGH